MDAAALASAVRIAREVAAETGLAPARVDGLLALKGVIVAGRGRVLDPMARAHRDAAILESLAAAFDTLAQERCGEGAKLAALLAPRSTKSRAWWRRRDVWRRPSRLPCATRLTAQVKELLDAAPVSEERLAQEVALLAVRADVREELDRLTAHVQERAP